MEPNQRPRRGFTLVELIVVIVVLAVLVGVALPKYFDYAGDARTAATEGTLGGVRAAVQNYFMNSTITGAAVYPALADLSNGNVMQEAIPVNPYDDDATVNAATEVQADARTLTGTGGWAYYTNGTDKVIFYANTDTTGVSENDF